VLAAFVRSKRYQIKSLNTKLQPASKSSKEKSIFNCPIMFNSADTSIAISSVTFQRKNTASNPKLVAYLSKLAKERLQLETKHRNIIDRLEILLLNYENHYNKINIEEISAHLGMSVNSLRNRLAKSNTNFRQIFNQFKLKRAKLILKEGRSVHVAAYLLGYSESSSFIRWFIGQTNISPSNYKKSVRN
jgi:AraC-like DNA-binding protein